MLDNVLFVYGKLIIWFKNDLFNILCDVKGVLLLLDGDVYYNVMLFMCMIIDLMVDEIYNIGLSEVDCLLVEMEKVKNEVGFDGMLNEFFFYIKFDVIDECFYYLNIDEGC